MRLDAADVEAIAVRLAEVLEERGLAVPSVPRLIDAAEVAARIGRGRDFVYEHAEDLGAVRLGEGARPRLAFDPRRVEEWLTALPGGVGSEGAEPGSTAGLPPRRRRIAPEGGPGNLPVRELDLSSLPERAARRGGSRPGPATGGSS